jgi:Fic family protein
MINLFLWSLKQGCLKLKIDELAEELRQQYTPKRGYGVMKLDSAPLDWQNIYFVVPKSPPKTLDIKLPYALLNAAMKIIGSLPHMTKMSDLDKLINYLFVRREVVQSSRLEGTWSTIDHILTPGDLVDKYEGKNEHQAVRSYANLLEDIIGAAALSKEKIFTEDFICMIHKRIVENDPQSNGIPGKMRTVGQPGAIVTIGGGIRKENSIFNPPPAIEVKRCLKEVLDWLSDEELAQKGDAAIGGLSLPIRLAIGHAHFEAVHPFTDGNGRTGRALWPVQMVCSGYMPLYLSGYVEHCKTNYSIALEEAQKKLNYIPIIEFICNAIIESDMENQKTKDAILKLEETWQERGKFRSKSGVRRALRLLLTKPIITTSIIETELNISKAASVNTINSLLAAKIIRLRKTEKRMRVYAAEELIQILSRPFGEDIELAIEKAHLLIG